MQGRRVTCSGRYLIGINSMSLGLVQLKFYYDRYKLRHIAPFLLLFVYSLAGAYAFYLVEHDYEKLLIK